MKQSSGIRICYLLYLSLLFSPLVGAVERLSLSGFGTLGLTTSDSDTLGFRADVATDHVVQSGEVSAKTDFILGGQVEATFNPQLVAVAQAVLKERVDQEIDDLVELFFLRYGPTPAWSLRVGRSALDVFQLTEYRNIGFSYLWARPPVEFYGISPYRSLDGVDISYTHRFSNSLLRAKGYVGISASPISTNYDTLEIELKKLVGLVLEYEIGKWRIRTSYSQDNVANEPNQVRQLQAGLQQFSQGIQQASALLPSALTLALPSLDQLGNNIDELSSSVSVLDDRIRYSALGVVYDNDQWLFQGELGRINSDSDSISGVTNAYLSVGRRYRSHTFYTFLASSTSDPTVVQSSAIDPYLSLFTQLGMPELAQGGERLLEGVDASLNFASPHQKSLSIGWRWDFSNSASLKLQWDHTRVKEKGDTYWLREPTKESRDETVNTTTLNMSFIF